jgi:Coenzyme PQQ synthesis protein D (PqqD)
MEMKVNMNAAYAPSSEVVVREIEGELIIVPLAAGIGDMEDELYTLNETGRVIWSRLDGSRTIEALVEELVDEYEAPSERIREDVIGLVQELLNRKMIVEAPVD